MKETNTHKEINMNVSETLNKMKTNKWMFVEIFHEDESRLLHMCHYSDNSGIYGSAAFLSHTSEMLLNHRS